MPVYWKDGSLNLLPLIGGNTHGWTQYIAEDKSGNVYITGGQYGGTLGLQLGYWKNSTFVVLASNAPAGENIQSIAVDTNGNVWVGGNVSGGSFFYQENSGSQTTLSGNPTHCWSLDADTQGNVYFMGVETTTDFVPYYWKNGLNPTALTLSGGNLFGYPAQMAEDSSGNLYICGEQWVDTAGPTVCGPVYWRTVSGVWQSATALPVGGYSSSYLAWWDVQGIAVDSSGNLHVAGGYGATSPDTTLLYWNSATSAPTVMPLPSGKTIGKLSTCATLDSNGNFIVTGQAGTAWSGTAGSSITDSVAVYWQNGTLINLPMGSGNAYGQTVGAVLAP